MNQKSQATKVVTNNKKNSVHKVQLKVATFAELWSNYPENKIEHLDPKTHKEVIDNHCAVYLSDCLIKSGISLKSFKGIRCWCCPSKENVHAIKAQQLADWLKLKPFAGCPEALQFTGKTFKKSLSGKTGIIFFQDYWQRDNEKGTKERTGDHIDLWKDGVLAGQPWIGSFARITLGLAIDGVWSDYTQSKKVLFWEIN